MNIDVPVAGDRRIEVVGNGLALWHGSQQAADATIVSPVTRAGDAQPGADVHPGRAVDSAARRKRRQTQPPSSACSLGNGALEMPAPLRAAACAAWVARWSGLLAVAAQRAIAASLLELPLAGECNLAGDAPELHEVLADVRWQLPVLGSRKGPR
eukprot:s6837_g5.t1